MARIGIDLDGVCYDFSGAVWRYAMEHEPKLPEKFPSFPGESRRWAFYEDWGWTLDEFLGVVDRGVDAGVIFDGPIRPGVREAFVDLFGGGHTLHIVTDRRSGWADNAKRNTFAWLDRHGLSADTVTFTADKTSVECDYFIEDKIENYDALDAAGVQVYLVDRPWNQVEGGDDRRRCDGIRHFAEIVFQEEQADAEDAAMDDDVPTVPWPVAEVGTSDEIRVVSETGGAKGSKLARFDLIPPEFLRALAEHYGRGAVKYDDDNWKRGYHWSLSYAALMRHLNSFWMGEEIDEEGFEHIVAVAWHAIALFWFARNQRAYDNRPKAA